MMVGAASTFGFLLATFGVHIAHGANIMGTTFMMDREHPSQKATSNRAAPRVGEGVAIPPTSLLHAQQSRLLAIKAPQMSPLQISKLVVFGAMTALGVTASYLALTLETAPTTWGVSWFSSSFFSKTAPSACIPHEDILILYMFFPLALLSVLLQGGSFDWSMILKKKVLIITGVIPTVLSVLCAISLYLYYYDGRSAARVYVFFHDHNLLIGTTIMSSINLVLAVIDFFLGSAFKKSHNASSIKKASVNFTLESTNWTCSPSEILGQPRTEHGNTCEQICMKDAQCRFFTKYVGSTNCTLYASCNTHVQARASDHIMTYRKR